MLSAGMNELTSNISELNLLCRVCLLSHNHAFNIFEDKCLYLYTYKEVLRECTSVQILKDDRLSSFICDVCASLLKSFLTLRTKVIETEILLKNILNGFQKTEEQSSNEEQGISRIKDIISDWDDDRDAENIEVCDENSQETLDSTGDLTNAIAADYGGFDVKLKNEIDADFKEEDFAGSAEKQSDNDLQLYKSLEECVDIKNDCENDDVQENGESNGMSDESKTNIFNEINLCPGFYDHLKNSLNADDGLENVDTQKNGESDGLLDESKANVFNEINWSAGCYSHLENSWNVDNGIENVDAQKNGESDELSDESKTNVFNEINLISGCYDYLENSSNVDDGLENVDAQKNEESDESKTNVFNEINLSSGCYDHLKNSSDVSDSLENVDAQKNGESGGLLDESKINCNDENVDVRETGDSNEGRSLYSNATNSTNQGESSVVEDDTENIYKCRFCKRTILTKKEFKWHVLKHYKYRCYICKKRFLLKVNLLKHREKHFHTCQICGKMFRSVLGSKKHMDKHLMEDGPFTDRNDSTFLSIESNSVSPHFFKCYVKLVDFKFEKAFSLRETIYIKDDHDSMEVQDDVESKTESSVACGNSRSSIKRNRKNAHPAQNAFKCKLCRKKYKTYKGLRQHSCIRQKNKSCNICKRKFKTVAALIKHGTQKKCTKSINSKRSKCNVLSFKCKTCHQLFESRKILTNHRLSHKKFTCLKCNKKFNSKTYLRQHERNHVKVKRPFKCKVCGLEFKAELRFYKHSFIHEGEKRPFQCDLCSASYYDYFDLFLHKRLHKW